MTRPMVALALAPVPPFAVWAARQPLAVLVLLLVLLLWVAAGAGYGLWSLRRPRTPSRPVVVDLTSRRRPHLPLKARSDRKPSPAGGPRVRHV